MSVVLRPMAGSDVPAVAKLEVVLFGEEAWSPDMLASELAGEPGKYYLVADEDGVIAGYAGLLATGGGQADVLTVGVAHDRWGEGIGAALVENLLTEAARSGDGTAIAFPRGKYRDGTLDFSFSGLKTSVARWVQARQQAGQPVPVADVAASFQEAVTDVLTSKALAACRAHGVRDLIVGGGVAANSRLRALAAERCAAAGIRLRVPRPGLCTDNGAMVAALGAELVARGAPASQLDVSADSSLPVTTVLVA